MRMGVRGRGTQYPIKETKMCHAATRADLPEYPGLPSKTRKTTVVVVPKKKRSRKSEDQPAEPPASEPEPKKD